MRIFLKKKYSQAIKTVIALNSRKKLFFSTGNTTGTVSSFWDFDTPERVSVTAPGVNSVT